MKMTNKTQLPALLLATGILCTTSAQADDLGGIYRLALDNDPQYLGAIATNRAAQEARPQARAALMPNVTLQANTAGNKQDGTVAPGTDRYNSHGYTLSITQPVFRWDRWVQLQQADSQIKQANAELDFSHQDLITRVATKYFDVLKAEDNLEFARNSKEAISQQLNQAQQRFEVGLIAITGVHEAQARYDQARTDEIVALNTLSNTWEDLREIIGVKPEKLALLKEQMPLEPPMPADVDEWSTMGLENSPIIKAASDATQVAQREIDVQYSDHYPTLDLVGSYRASRFGDDDLLDTNNGSIAVELNVPIYTGGGVTASTRQARYQMIASQERLDQARRAVDKEVRNSFRGVHASISAVKSLQAGIVSAQSSVEATEAGFDVGTRTLVDVLNEQRDLYAAKRDFARARYNYVLTGLRLKQATGLFTEEDLVKVNGLLELNQE